MSEIRDGGEDSPRQTSIKVLIRWQILVILSIEIDIFNLTFDAHALLMPFSL